MIHALQKFNSKTGLVIAISLIVLGVGLVMLNFYGEYMLVVNGTAQEIITLAFTPAQVIRAAGYTLQSGDRAFPPAGQLNLNQTNIVLQRALPVEVVSGSESVELLTTERVPANLLELAGFRIFPGDRLMWNGALVDPAQPLPDGQAVILQFEPAKRIALNLDGTEQVLFTDQRTIGEALWKAGIPVHPEDALSLPLGTTLRAVNELDIRRARLVTVTIGTQTVSGFSAAITVADALADLTLTPQNLDYTVPPEDRPVPKNGEIHLVQVQEQILLEKDETAYVNSYQDDPDTELDMTSVLVPGQLGLVITRSRVRMEDGEQTAILTEGPWKASDPMDGVLGRGTHVVVRTETIYGDTIEYWRKVTVYATSYTPSSQGGHTGTASGIPLTKGVIAVTRAWYNGMAFQQVYVPGYGYGTIADTGGGIDGRYWIDLGFDDSNYESWHYWTTMYFLTPVPGYIPVILP